VSFVATELVPEGVVWRPSMTESEAACIGDGLVRALGAARVRELPFGRYPWHTLGFALTATVDRSEAEQIVDTFAACSPSWELLLITSATQGSEQISDESARCASEQLADEDARVAFVAELDRAYDDAATGVQAPDLSHLDPLLAALEACLTAEELDGLDWN
jgi:hypothetical protein